MMSSSIHKKILPTAVLLIPPAILFRDKFYSTYTVKNDSMEPILKRNDIVLVRKVDFFPYYHKHGIEIHDLQGDNSSPKIEEETDRIKMLKMDASAGKIPINELTFWCSPPLTLPGDIVFYKNPQTFTNQLIECARVIGLGGQRVSHVYLSQ